jgi:hypothetical protein
LIYSFIISSSPLAFSFLSFRTHLKPIYKNKGDKFDPKNYRPITIVSCLGKLFTAILNERLTEFSESFSGLSENQSGFRKGYSTSDNMFTLQSFFEILKCKKKKNVLRIR